MLSNVEGLQRFRDAVNNHLDCCPLGTFWPFTDPKQIQKLQQTTIPKTESVSYFHVIMGHVNPTVQNEHPA